MHPMRAVAGRASPGWQVCCYSDPNRRRSALGTTIPGHLARGSSCNVRMYVMIAKIRPLQYFV
jgi:hypothetical protein